MPMTFKVRRIVASPRLTRRGSAFVAVVGLFTLSCTSAFAAEDHAALTLRGVIHKSVKVALDSGQPPVGGPFAGPGNIVHIQEEANFAGRYLMFLEGGNGASRMTFDGRPVAFDGGRGLLESQGLGDNGRTTRRTRDLALDTHSKTPNEHPMFVVIRTR